MAWKPLLPVLLLALPSCSTMPPSAPPPDFDSAWDYQDPAAKELGECLLLLGQPDEARPHCAAAYARLAQDPLFAAQEPERLERLRALGAGGP